MIDPQFSIYVEYNMAEEGKVVRASKQFFNLSDFLRWLTTFDEIDAINITFNFSKQEVKMEQKSPPKEFHPCPFVDGNSCHNDCPLWGKTVLKISGRDDILPKQLYGRVQDFEGCLLAAGMLALVSIANFSEKSR